MNPSLILAFVGSVLADAPAHGVSIPRELLYRLPQGYSGDPEKHFIDTITTDASINAIFAAARNATFYSYDHEFDDIVGSPTIRVIKANNSTFAYANEGGAWVPKLNQVYFTGSGGDPNPYYVLDLDDYSIKLPNANFTQPPPSLAGAEYFNGTVYLASLGLKSANSTPAIYGIDTTTGEMSTLLNTYAGIPFNSIDDLSWSNTACKEDNVFFSSIDLGVVGENLFSDAVLPNAVYRFTPSTQSLQAVVSRADILAPNGVHVDPAGRLLYLTDVARVDLSGPGSSSSGSAAIYKYDLDDNCTPVNKRLFAIARSGHPDGIKIDNSGRVWTAEFNGIVVRDPNGRELGVFNAEQLVDTASYPISNFALAGDKLVLFAGDQVSVIQLGQNVTEPAGSGSCAANAKSKREREKQGETSVV